MLPNITLDNLWRVGLEKPAAGASVWTYTIPGDETRTLYIPTLISCKHYTSVDVATRALRLEIITPVRTIGSIRDNTGQTAGSNSRFTWGLGLDTSTSGQSTARRFPLPLCYLKAGDSLSFKIETVQATDQLSEGYVSGLVFRNLDDLYLSQFNELTR